MGDDGNSMWWRPDVWFIYTLANEAAPSVEMEADNSSFSSADTLAALDADRLPIVPGIGC